MPLFDRPPIDAISVSNSQFSSGTFRITGGAGITVSSDASGASVVGLGAATLTYGDNMVQQAGTSALGTLAVSAGTLGVSPLSPANEFWPGIMSLGTVNMLGSFVTSSTSPAAQTFSLRVGLYTRVNATQLGLLNSGLFSTGLAAGATTGVQGLRWITFHSSVWSSQPQMATNSRYYCAWVVNTSLGSPSVSMLGQFHLGSSQMSGTFGLASNSNASNAKFPLMGLLSVSTNAMPATINASALVGQGNAADGFVPFIAFNNLTATF